jgi:uncharacterized protein YfbU (UPF0304 family)
MNEVTTINIPVTNPKAPQGLTEVDIHRLFGSMTKAKTKAILQTIRTYCELVVSLHLQQEMEAIQAIQATQKIKTGAKENNILPLLPLRQAA